jgi:hypothetical protein
MDDIEIQVKMGLLLIGYYYSNGRITINNNNPIFHSHKHGITIDIFPSRWRSSPSTSPRDMPRPGLRPPCPGDTATLGPKNWKKCYKNGGNLVFTHEKW